MMAAMPPLLPVVGLLFVIAMPRSGAAQVPGLDDCDVVWTTPSRDASGAMPIGNGEVGCSVWCTPAGELQFYVARTDSFSEASRLLKLGRVRVQVRPPEPGEPFEQRLCLREGCIRVTLGAGERRLVLRLFVDSDADVVHVVGESARPEQLVVEVDSWRRAARRLTGEEGKSSWTMREAPDAVVVEESADEAVRTDQQARLGCVHRNGSSVVAFTAARQGLDPQAVPDLLLHRAFGLLAQVAGGGAGSMREPLPAILVAPRATTFALQIAAPCLQEGERGQWEARANALLDAADAAAAQARTAAWWAAFWQRSWVFVAGDRIAAVPANAHPLRLGVDSGGGNRFVGAIERVRILVDEREVFATAPGRDLPVVVADLQALSLPNGFRIEAVLQQDAAHPIGRIVDKLTAGRGDGFLFDTYPGDSLRLIVGDRELVAKGSCPAGARHEVAAAFAAATGRMQIYCDGVVVADSADSQGGAARPLDEAPASRLSRALSLQRWVQACGGRGAFPIKFNGSIFTVEPSFTGDQPFDADWRRWGDCYWWQNTRLPYYPMLAQGDFDMQEPLFRLYRATLAVAEHRVRQWHGDAEGAYWPETMTPFGTHANGDYGWQRDGVPANKVLCPWWEYARNQGLELLALMLDRWDYEREPAFVRDELWPMAGPVLAWFATAYHRGDDGILHIEPTQSLETYWHGVRDDMPTVAGLHDVLPRLLALPAAVLPDGHEAVRAGWRALLAALPPLPIAEQDGVRMLLPAAAFDSQRSNCECPELYAVFPFALFGLGKDGLELARAAYQHRHDRFTNGWPQDGQLAALLGYVDDARDNVLAKLQNHNHGHRFPVMWGPNFDWLPDQCHGSNLLDTVQRMLLQCDGERLVVLPCWPCAWDVSFRLHAPGRVVVECEFRAGRVERLEVTPTERRGDVVMGIDAR